MNSDEQKKHTTALQQLKTDTTKAIEELTSDVTAVLDKIVADVNISLAKIVGTQYENRKEELDSLALFADRIEALSNQLDRVQLDARNSERATIQIQSDLIDAFAMPTYAGLWGRIVWLIMGRDPYLLARRTAASSVFSDEDELLDDTTVLGAPGQGLLSSGDSERP